jgi:hypothetical protein
METQILNAIYKQVDEADVEKVNHSFITRGLSAAQRLGGGDYR